LPLAFVTVAPVGLILAVVKPIRVVALKKVGSGLSEALAIVDFVLPGIGELVGNCGELLGQLHGASVARAGDTIFVLRDAGVARIRAGAV
jgi:hypothetical protein